MDDSMSAWMTIRKSGKLIDEKEITELIDSAGIRNGLEEAIQKMNKEGFERDFDTPFPLAFCKANTTDKRINYHFDSHFDDPQNIDYSRLAEFAYVGRDAVLADFSYNLFDSDGSIYNIFGELLGTEQKIPENLRDLAGHGVSYEESDHCFVALSTGYPYIDKTGKICLLDTLIINHSLQHSNLKTPLSLIINAEVKDCDLVSPSDIVINGDLIASRVFCEGGLRIEGSIIDCKESYLHLLGEVHCHSIINSRLITQSKIIFSKEIIESQVIAEKGVVSTNSFSMIHSGNIQSSGSVHAGFLGNLDANPLEIEITISAYYKNLLMIKTKELIKQKQNLDSDSEIIIQLNEEIKAMENDLDQDMSIFLQHERSEPLSVKADQTIYPHTTIRILKHSYHIKSPQQGAEYLEKD